MHYDIIFNNRDFDTVVYVLRLTIKEHTIGLKEMFTTIVLSMIGIVIFTVIGVLSGQNINIASLIFASLITGNMGTIIIRCI